MGKVIGFSNFLDSIVSYLKNENTAQRTYTFPDRSGTIGLEEADTVSITGAVTLDGTAFGKMHLCTGTTSDYTITLPTASGNSGKSIAFICSPALTKLVTIDGASTETIGGDLTKVVWAKEVITIMSDGTNWLVLSYKPRPFFAQMSRNPVESIPWNVATKLNLNTVGIDNSGIFASSVNGNFVIPRTGYYIAKANINPVTSTNTTPDLQAYLYANGALSIGFSNYQLVPAANQRLALNPYTRPVLLNKGDVMDLRIYHNTTGGGARDFGGSLNLEEVIG